MTQNTAGQPSSPPLTLNSGHSIPQIGFGTWLIKPEEVGEIVKSAVRNGYRHIDCAYIYGNQEPIGTALKELLDAGEIKRSELFVTSKVWNIYHSYERALQNIDESLEMLGLDYLDMMLIHWPMGYQEGEERFPKNEAGDKVLLSDVDYLETWKALEKALNDGKLRSIGLSNFNSEQIQRVLDNCQIKPSNLQVECHPYFQQKGLRKFCESVGIQMTAYCPLASSPQNPLKSENYRKIADDPVIAKIAAAHGKTIVQVVLRFLTQLGLCVVPKSSSPERQRQNLALFDFALSDAEMAQMEALDTRARIIHLKLSEHSPLFPWGEGKPDF